MLGVDFLEKLIIYPEIRIFILKYGSRTEAHEDMWNLPRDYIVEGNLKGVLFLRLTIHYAILQLIYPIFGT